MTAPRTTNARRVVSRADLALAASLLGVAVLSGFFVDSNRPDTVEPATWWHWLLIAVPSILVAGRRINPAVVAVLATVAQACIWVTNLPEVLLPIIVILYTAASDANARGRDVAIACGIVLAIVTAIGVRIADDVTVYQLPLIVLTCGTAIVLGVNAARQRTAAEELAANVTESRLRSEHERAQAVSEERSHIARELHDIIGHTLSVIAVRAESAHRVAEHKPGVAVEAVGAIADASRDALTETRKVLAGLQRSTSVDLAPPPDLQATRRLVTELADAGVDATFTENGCDEHVPSAVVAGGTYRIVQESLTNAIKHGGQDVTVAVELTSRDDRLEIRVRNTVHSGSNAMTTDEAGMGIAGMEERAEVLGGTFHAERTKEHFTVTAVLPNRTSTIRNGTP